MSEIHTLIIKALTKMSQHYNKASIVTYIKSDNLKTLYCDYEMKNRNKSKNVVHELS